MLVVVVAAALLVVVDVAVVSWPRSNLLDCYSDHRSHGISWRHALAHNLVAPVAAICVFLLLLLLLLLLPLLLLLLPCCSCSCPATMISLLVLDAAIAV